MLICGLADSVNQTLHFFSPFEKVFCRLALVGSTARSAGKQARSVTAVKSQFISKRSQACQKAQDRRRPIPTSPRSTPWQTLGALSPFISVYISQDTCAMWRVTLCMSGKTVLRKYPPQKQIVAIQYFLDFVLSLFAFVLRFVYQWKRLLSSVSMGLYRSNCSRLCLWRKCDCLTFPSPIWSICLGQSVFKLFFTFQTPKHIFPRNTDIFDTYHLILFYIKKTLLNYMTLFL